MDKLAAQAAMKLETSGKIIVLLCQGVSDEQARWRPSRDRWTLTEIMHHLYDEEREDFRAAIEIILQRPDNPWPQIDPMDWVHTRSYNEKNMTSVLQGFQTERNASVQWIHGLPNVNWDSPHSGPGGCNPTNAGNTLASWVAHDLMHIHQLSDLLRDMIEEEFSPYSGAYAGRLS